MDCFQTHQSSTQKFFAHRAFLGAHLDQFQFPIARVEFSGLNSWAHELTGFKDNQVEHGLSYESPKPFQGSLRNCKYTLGAAYEYSATSRKRSFSESVGFSFEFDGKLLESEMQAFLHTVQNFLTFATDKPNAFTKLEVETERFDFRRIRVIGPKVFSDPTLAARLRPGEMLFTLTEVKDRLQEIMQKWVNLANRCKDVFAIYFSTRYAPSAYTDFQLQFVAQALSLYHVGRSKLAKDLSESHPVETAAAAIRKLGAEQAATFEPLIAKRFPTGLFGFSTHAVDTLYYIYTRDDSRYPKGDRGALYFWLAEVLSELLKMCILTEIGFSENEIRELFLRNPQYQYLCIGN